jgi:hypothetical protein
VLIIGHQAFGTDEPNTLASVLIGKKKFHTSLARPIAMCNQSCILQCANFDLDRSINAVLTSPPL